MIYGNDKIWNVRNSGVDKVELALKFRRDGIAERADSRLSSAGVRVGSKVGVEQLVGLADGDGHLQPVSSRRDRLYGQTGLLQPRIDGLDGLRGRCNVLLDLL